MPTVCPDTDHFIGDFDAARRRDAVAQLRSQLSVTAEIGGEGVLTPASWGMFSLRLPPFTPPRQPAEDHAVLLEALVELARARRPGGRLARPGADQPVRGLHGQPRWSRRPTSAEEVRARDRVTTRCGWCADLFHMNIEEDDLADGDHRGRRHGSRHVHVDDSNRLQPGTGHLDFAAVFTALHDHRLRPMAGAWSAGCAATRRRRSPRPPASCDPSSRRPPDADCVSGARRLSPVRRPIDRRRSRSPAGRRVSRSSGSGPRRRSSLSALIAARSRRPA